MFVGTKDEIATVEDNRIVRSLISSVVHYKEYALGHLSFFMAKDMSYFLVDAMNLL